MTASMKNIDLLARFRSKKLFLLGFSGSALPCDAPQVLCDLVLQLGSRVFVQVDRELAFPVRGHVRAPLLSLGSTGCSRDRAARVWLVLLVPVGSPSSCFRIGLALGLGLMCLVSAGLRVVI